MSSRKWKGGRGSDILVQSLGSMWRCPAEDQDTVAGTGGTEVQGIEKPKIPGVHRNPLRATQVSGEGNMEPSEIREQMEAQRSPEV